MVTRFRKGKSHSAVSAQVLHGVPHGKGISAVRKLGKTQKRPSAMFGGVLSGRERSMVFVEAAKIVSGAKKIGETDVRLRRFIGQAAGRMVSKNA